MKKKYIYIAFVGVALTLSLIATNNNMNVVIDENIEALSSKEQKKYTYRECYKAGKTELTTGRICDDNTDLSILALDIWGLEYIDQLLPTITGRDAIIQGTYACLDVGYTQLIPIMHGLCYFINY
mgnify:CR=1 FL=1